jgi:hypothetical protein
MEGPGLDYEIPCFMQSQLLLLDLHLLLLDVVPTTYACLFSAFCLELAA